MKCVPVVEKFGGKIIGHMVLLEDAIPEHGNYVFAIAGKASMAENGKPGELPTHPIIGKFELIEVCIVSDTDYAAYLRQTGVV